MPERTIEVSDTELAILEVLWEQGQATIREIDRRLYDRPTTATYAAVQKLLEHLEAKGCVTRDRNASSMSSDRRLIGQSSLTDVCRKWPISSAADRSHH